MKISGLFLVLDDGTLWGRSLLVDDILEPSFLSVDRVWLVGALEVVGGSLLDVVPAQVGWPCSYVSLVYQPCYLLVIHALGRASPT